MTALMLAAMVMSAEPKKAAAQHIDFENDLIKGSTLTSDIEVITYRNSPKFKSLIKVRENFDDKIVRSVDQM